MKADKIRENILIVTLYVVLFFNFFVLNIFDNKNIFAIFLCIYVITCKIFVKSSKVNNVNKKMIK